MKSTVPVRAGPTRTGRIGVPEKFAFGDFSAFKISYGQIMTEWISLLENDDYLGVKKLISEGGDVNAHNEHEESVLAYAIKCRCNDELLGLIIENGADLFDFDEEGVSIFDYAIAYNNISIVKRLLAAGVDVNSTRRKSGFTPLMGAVSYGRKEIVELLLENGANVDAVDSKGYTAADFARKMHKKSMLLLLEP
jgi:ankyrin repeat protein